MFGAKKDDIQFIHSIGYLFLDHENMSKSFVSYKDTKLFRKPGFNYLPNVLHFFTLKIFNMLNLIFCLLNKFPLSLLDFFKTRHCSFQLYRNM